MHDIYVKNGYFYTETGLVRGSLLARSGVIAEIGSPQVPAGVAVYDAENNLVLPGFLDLHTHGAVGVDMNDTDVDGVRRVAEYFASQGVAGFLPTLLTDSKERLLQSIQVLAKAKEELNTGARILGIHLEGPYLCSQYKGAMPENLLQLPNLEDFEEYQRAARGCIRRITISPEVQGAPDFIKQISRDGVAVSLGHSGADYETTWECIRKGAASVTHIFNAMKLMHQHFPAISGAALESDVYCEAICDGIHLHPGMVRILLKAKGYGRVVAVTDSIMAAGLGDGLFKLGVNDIRVTNGDAMLADGSARAGSTLTMARAMRNLVGFTGKTPQELSQLLSKNPADLLGMGAKKGSLAVGKDADLVVLSSDLEVQSTIVQGQCIFQK